MNVSEVERIAAIEAKIDNLEGWQKAQNGSIKEIRGMVTSLGYQMSRGLVLAAVAVLGIVGNLAVALLK